MAELRPILTLWGEQFSPRRAEEVIGFNLSDKKEPGEIGLRGQYKGMPLPYGSAFVRVPAEIEQTRRLPWLIEFAENHRSALQALGASLCKLHLDVRYLEQCNLEFDSGELARIVALGVLFTIACWENSATKDSD